MPWEYRILGIVLDSTHLLMHSTGSRAFRNIKKVCILINKFIIFKLNFLYWKERIETHNRMCLLQNKPEAVGSFFYWAYAWLIFFFPFSNFCTSMPYLKFLSLVDIIKGRICPLGCKFSLLYFLGPERSFADLPDILHKIISSPSKESKKLFLNVPSFLMALNNFVSTAAVISIYSIRMWKVIHS